MVSDNEPRYRLLDSSGAVVGTIYEQTDGSLALQEATSENEIALQPDGDITAVGSVLRRLGHDEVDVPQTFDLVTDDFERASLGSEYVGDTQDAQIQSSVALEGERSLEISRSSTGGSFVSYTGEDVPQFGDSWETFHRLTDTDDINVISFFKSDPTVAYTDSTAVAVRMTAKNDSFQLQQFVAGGFINTQAGSAPLSSNLNETLRVKHNVTLDGVHTATLFDSTGSELATVTLDIDSRVASSGAVGYRARNTVTSPTQYFDGPFITRRLGEETRERQRGATETSKLQTRGGVGAGPRILPQNRAAEIMSDQGITSALVAGTEVSYGLQLNGRKMLTIFGEADGSGGLQNPAVDFESRQLKDVSNNQTGDSMTANPEADTEDGFIEVELGGTAYQIPVYQA